MNESELLTELTTARRERKTLEHIWKKKRDEAVEAKKAWKAAAARVEEIMDDADPLIEEAERPMLAMLHRIEAAVDKRDADRAAAIAAAPSGNPGAPGQAQARKGKPKRDRPDAKLAGLELPTAKEILDDLIGPELHGIDVLKLSRAVENGLKAAGIRTVGDLASDKCPLIFDDAGRVARAYLAAHAQSDTPAAVDAPESTPGASAAKPEAPTQAGKPFWTSDDLSRELFHACTLGSKALKVLVDSGGTNDQIRDALCWAWPHARRFVPPEQSGGKNGYTIASGREPRFWIGVCLGSGHKPALAGDGLYSRVRDLLQIPQPAPAFVAAPDDGWDEASLANAAEDLGTTPPLLVVCLDCNAVRKFGGAFLCLRCKSTHCGEPVPGIRPDAAPPAPKKPRPVYFGGNDSREGEGNKPRKGAPRATRRE